MLTEWKASVVVVVSMRILCCVIHTGGKTNPVVIRPRYVMPIRLNMPAQ